MEQTTAQSGNPPRQPLAPVLVFIGINSLGTGAVTSGVFFILKQSLGYGPLGNYAAAIFMSAIYVAAAFAAGPFVRKLEGHGPARTARRTVSARATLLMIMLGLAAACCLPMLFGSVASAPAWTLWTLLAVYGSLTGLMWPIAESYVTGGRRGGSLRKALGGFNVVWSVAMVLAFWGMAPLLDQRPLVILAALGTAHALCIPLLIWFRPKPIPPEENTGEPHPPVYERLLVTFRVLLPIGYVAMSALTPFLPAILARLEVAVAWQTPIASTYLITRVGAFAVFGLWHGWRGTWAAPITAMVGMILSFAACVLTPVMGWGVPGLMVALAVFGISQAGVYQGAIYYAQSVGASSVDAGGSHEGLIGVGYTVGPIIGVIIASIVGAEAPAFEPALSAVTGVVLIAGTIWALRMGRRAVPKPLGVTDPAG